jgi:hypothetical protein
MKVSRKSTHLDDIRHFVTYEPEVVALCYRVSFNIMGHLPRELLKVTVDYTEWF